MNIIRKISSIKKVLHTTSEKSGKAPGTLVYVGTKDQEKVKIEVIDYTKTKLHEAEVEEAEKVFDFRDTKSISWLNITGIHKKEIIKKIGDHYNLHPLLLEDVMNTHQRPKLDIYRNEIFMVLKMIYYDEKTSQIETEQVSIVVGKGFLISFLEDEGDVFSNVRSRIREQKSKIREKESDFLAYALLDSIVDNYFISLERVGEKLEDIERDLIENPSPKTLNDIYTLRREIILLRKSVWPLREVIGALNKEDSNFVKEETKAYIRDLYDHTIRAIDTVETFRDLLSGMLDLYMSSISNRLNEVMKVLTIITTIFIPLSFVAGIYGMNFEHMPELSYYMGYPLVLAGMLIIAAGMIIYFKMKKWI